jgi:hypothetical protein
MPTPVESFAAKTVGKAAGLRSRQGLVGVFNVLAQQHEEAATLLSHTQEADNPEKRKQLWSAVRCDLICHERAELSTVYPVFSGNPTGADISRQHAEGARELESAIAAVDALGFESTRWREALQRLSHLIQRHVEQEEQEFFFRAQDTIGKEAAQALERPFLAAVKQCRKELGG